MKFLYVLILITGLFFLGCNNKTEETVQIARIQKIPFIPPRDSSITRKQVQKWLATTALLDSLSYIYSDSFNTENPEKNMNYQKRFIKAQDSICIKQGLLGGYDEYVWVSQHIGLKKNSFLLDSSDNSRFLE
jgi:hypothetical protein